MGDMVLHVLQKGFYLYEFTIIFKWLWNRFNVIHIVIIYIQF